MLMMVMIMILMSCLFLHERNDDGSDDASAGGADVHDDNQITKYLQNVTCFCKNVLFC